MTIDIDSLLIMGWMVTKEKLYNSRVTRDMIVSVRNYYILLQIQFPMHGTYAIMCLKTHMHFL